MGAAYPLAPADVQASLDEQGDSALRESGMYNVNVLDYLLGVQMEDESDEDYIERERRASVLVRALVRNGDREQIFIDAYFSLGSELHAFVQALAASWPGVFSLIVSRSELGHENRLALFNSALEAMAEGLDYQERIKIERLFIEEHFAQLPVLTSSSDSELADRIATAFGNGSVKLSTLEPLSAEIRRAITSVNGYKVTRENLRLALESQDLSLDQIKEADRTVYQYVLSELESYLVAAREGDTGALIVAESGSLAMIVSDVFAANADLLPEVLEGAVQGSTIGQISGVPAGSWPVLADFRVFPATASNVTAYIATAGEIDAHLGALLANSRKILHPEDIEQIERVALAEQILAAKGNIPDAATRVALVVTLRLESFLSPSSVPAEDGPLLGLLIAQKVIDDDEDSFALALTQDWKTRELAISKSKKFETFVTTRELPLEDIARLTSSDLILDSLKALIIERADEFVPTDNRVALTALASHALKQNIELPVPLVSRMAVAGVSHEIVVPLLEPILDRLDQSQLSSILTSLGGNYAIAAVRNGKRPKLRKTESNLALAGRLEALEIAKSHSIEADHIRINMRR